MEPLCHHPISNVEGPDSPLPTSLWVLLVAAVSYLAPALEGAFMLHPETVWPLWPSCALLVSVLVLVPRRIWPILMATAFAAIGLFDLQEGVPIGSIVWFIAADTVEVLIAAWSLSFFFDGVPRLNSVKSVAKYLFFVVILAPFAAVFIAAPGIRGGYWYGWRVAFFSDALALLTLTPAILSWVTDGRAWIRKSLAYRLEAAVLFASVVLLAYLNFVSSASSDSPALLYSLVPCLMWSALRFGSIGVSTSIVIVNFLSVWGAVHNRGPFTGPGPVDQVLSLQLFLVFTATSFMILAALVEDRKLSHSELRESEERLRLAVQAGNMYAFDWDSTTDVIVRSGQCRDVFNWIEDPTRDTGRQFVLRLHPDDREKYATPDATPKNPGFQTNYRVLRPDGGVIWLEARGRAFFDPQGRMLRIIGMVADVTARKQTEEALLRREAELAEAYRLAGLGTWQWDPANDKVTWSEELYRIAGRDPHLPPVNYKEYPKLYTAESWERLRRALEEALRNGTPYELDVQLVRPDGSRRWLHARGEGQLDTAGRIVLLRGTVQDIAERKEAEAALRSLSGRLIVAQEEERRHIARELHDDFSQRMALLQIGLEQFEQDANGLPTKARQKLHKCAEIAAEISSDIHDLSHRLRPSRLDVLSLVPSLTGICREFSENHRLQVQFAYHDIPKQISKDVTLCLYRTVQEALQNVVKHSAATEARVELSGFGDRIELCVQDAGVGFDPQSAKTGDGFGLVSMSERLRLVGGDLRVESEPSHGTRIRARAPLARSQCASQ